MDGKEVWRWVGKPISRYFLCMMDASCMRYAVCGMYVVEYV